MVQKIKINFEAVEAMIFYWHSLKDKQKVSGQFIYDLIQMPGLTNAYDDEFTDESVRICLEAIMNREPYQNKNKKEGRFWSNNLWMMEDLGCTDLMIQPIKRLNLDNIVDKLSELDNNNKFEEIEVIFSPLHISEYLIKDNKLIINFFKVTPNDKDEVFINEQPLKEYIFDKIQEIIK
jgi:hypothetical protein